MDDCKLTKRAFLQSVAAGTPTLRLMLGGTQASPTADTEGKFTPVDCSKHFNASAADLGPKDRAKDLSPQSERDRLIRTPGGKRVFRGIPFGLGPEGAGEKRWIALSRARNPWSARSEERRVGKECRS